ncbi:hypothetical protein IAU60_006636 [Kwoniella sp. DSM 27419]
MSDKYTNESQTAPSLTEKLGDLRGFLNSLSSVLLTTHAPDGSLHARCMAIAEITPDWKFRFIYDRESYKDTELENDTHVNIAADNMKQNQGWVSIAGKANRITDKETIEKLWNPSTKAWFADKGDGVHDGTPSDPRVAIFQVKVDEIRHFYQKKTSIGTMVDVVSSAITGSTATPGEVRTITGEEIASAWNAGQLREP